MKSLFLMTSVMLLAHFAQAADSTFAFSCVGAGIAVDGTIEETYGAPIAAPVEIFFAGKNISKRKVMNMRATLGKRSRIIRFDVPGSFKNVRLELQDNLDNSYVNGKALITLSSTRSERLDCGAVSNP